MSLKRIIETLEGLDETTAKLYAKGADGKFHLDLDGDDEPGEGLKSALQKERKAREDAERALKAREKAEEDAKRKTEEELALKRGEFDKIRAQDQEALKESQAKLEALESRIRNGSMERAAMEAIQAAKGIPKALLPHILPNLEAIPEGDGYAVRVKGAPEKKLTDYVSSLKADMAWGFEGTGASGGGAGQSDGTPSAHAAIFDPKSPTYNYTKQMELAKENPALFQSLRTQYPETKQE